MKKQTFVQFNLFEFLKFCTSQPKQFINFNIKVQNKVLKCTIEFQAKNTPINQ